ncbi:hypothetical protein QNO07_26625 [Streptomyces sp. 549]|uniref:hypothetical protein n=1 Tax=Streptomyces sp. 549 TaxID=3049076 RepID=UPI0024C2CE97|nr:hypothetical protein [Streptomyces sp. 549]MDK1476933.1 hypothetical protein [Streptomyces sp. 549]
MCEGNSSTEEDLRRLLNEWDPIGVSDLVQDEYDCLLAPLLRRLGAGSSKEKIGDFLRHELEEHFGLDPRGLEPEAMAARLIAWWAPAAPDDRSCPG